MAPGRGREQANRLVGCRVFNSQAGMYAASTLGRVVSIHLTRPFRQLELAIPLAPKGPNGPLGGARRAGFMARQRRFFRLRPVVPGVAPGSNTVAWRPSRAVARLTGSVRGPNGGRLGCPHYPTLSRCPGRGYESDRALRDRAFSGKQHRYRGSATLKQTDFGMKPIRIAGGAIKVKDEVKIDFDILTH